MLITQRLARWKSLCSAYTTLTWSLLVEAMISERPMQTPCLWSASSESRPLSRMGIISGSTLSPSFRTKSPNVRAATYKFYKSYALEEQQKEKKLLLVMYIIKEIWWLFIIIFHPFSISKQLSFIFNFFSPLNQVPMCILSLEGP